MVLWTRPPLPVHNLLKEAPQRGITSGMTVSAEQKSKFDEKQQQVEASESMAVVISAKFYLQKIQEIMRSFGTNDD